jgi:hypothetical protein
MSIAAAIGAAISLNAWAMAAASVDRERAVILAPPELGRGPSAVNALEAKGRIARVDPVRSELVLTETFKNLTFKLTKDTTILLNGRPSRLTELREGDTAAVTHTRIGPHLVASLVRGTRKFTRTIDSTARQPRRSASTKADLTAFQTHGEP